MRVAFTSNCSREEGVAFSQAGQIFVHEYTPIFALNEDLKASFCLQLLIRVELHKMVIPVGPEANNFAFIEMGSYIFTCPERRIIRQPVTKKNLFYFKVYKYKSNLYRCKYIY